MEFIKAKFDSKCAVCSNLIPKGINMLYDYTTKKAYCLPCGTDIEQEQKKILNETTKESA